MEHATKNGYKPPGLVWIDCTYPVLTSGLLRILESEARVHVGPEPPKNGEGPSGVVFCADDTEDISQSVQRIKSAYPSAAVIAFCLRSDLPRAWAALRAGARGYIHAKMQPEQMLRALRVALQGEIAAPRDLLEYVIGEDNGSAKLDALSARQEEILRLVDKGLSNRLIADRLGLSESTVKQHLRAAYKVLDVSNRTEAAAVVRHSLRSRSEGGEESQ